MVAWIVIEILLNDNGGGHKNISSPLLTLMAHFRGCCGNFKGVIKSIAANPRHRPKTGELETVDL